MLHLEFNSDSENEGIARIVTAAYIMKFDPDMEEMDDIKTAVSEAVTNCIVHAYHNPDGKISMDLSDQNGILRIEIKDQGIGIPDVKKGIAIALVFLGVYIVTQSKSRADLEKAEKPH